MEAEKSDQIILEVKGVVKSFGSNKVLKGIDLSAQKGKVLALIGGNGAGKSTLMKIIMGLYKADLGEVKVNGRTVNISSAGDSLATGIYMVPQEPLLFPHMTLLENILIGIKGNRKELNRRVDELLHKYKWSINLNSLAEGLSVAKQQIVELMRALVRDANVLILDEPTGALTFDEVETLYSIIDELKRNGKAIIYITHRLGEIFRIADTIDIMRDGVITVSGKVADFTEKDLIKGLLPDNPENKVQEQNLTAFGNSEEDADNSADEEIYRQKPVLELQNYTGYGFSDINLKIYPGEILGVAGVVGAGRTELAIGIFGLEKVVSGKCLLENRDITNLSTKEILLAGINYVTEDRSVNGLFKIRSVLNNLCSSFLLLEKKKGAFVDEQAEKELTDYYVRKFRIKISSQEQEVGDLSGGNQQKIMIARALSTKPKLVILDEPTRGIDAGARADIYRIIGELRKAGVAVMLISSDMEEIVALSTRAVVICQGRILETLQRTDITPEKLMAASFGVK